MCSSSGGVQSVPSASTQNSDEVGASSTRPCGVTSSASSKPRSCASRGEHVGGVGERLDAVEHARGRVRHDAEPDAGRLGGSGSVSSRRRPPRVSTMRRQPSNSPPPRASSSSGISASSSARGTRPARRRFAAERSSRSRWSASANGRPVVDADHLEGPVAAQQTLVGGGNRELVGGGDPPVDRAQLGRLRCSSAMRRSCQTPASASPTRFSKAAALKGLCRKPALWGRTSGSPTDSSV